VKKSVALLLAIISVSITFTAIAQSPPQFLTPGANLVIEGIPPIEIALTKKVEAYTEFRPSSIVAWHPAKTAMLIRTRPANGNTAQLHLVEQAGDKPIAVTDFPDAVSNATFQPKKGEYILFERGAGGNEVFRIFRLDLSSKEITAVSPDNERASAPSWNRRGDKIVFTTSTIDRFNRGEGATRTATTKLYIADPLKPSDAKLITTFEGGRWFNFRFSPDDKTLLFSEYLSANESHLWTMNIASGKKTRVTPARKDGEIAISYGNARYTRDGKGVLTTSDRDSEFKRLVYIALATGKETVLTGHLNFDVDDFAVSYSARRIAFLTNENGSSVLRFLDLDTKKELPRPALLAGEISGLRWKVSDEDDAGNAAGKLLAFNLTSAKSPGEVFSYDIGTTKMLRWTNGAATGLNPLEFVDPQLVKWKSFDGLGISGFLYQPDAKKFPGKRPVILNIHGGPEAQARPGFIARNNYMVNEMGIAILYPNVRGSSGFGKTFLAADNGFKREDSVKDIGALFDWIATQPDLDASKVMVMGGSYGGYMTLAVATNYPDKIAGGISSVGISNFITFLTNTESYRRDLRRVEYGDERDPKMREFLEKISPLNNANKMKKPMMIVQGKNDPRVPYTESVQIVEQLKKQGTPVWFLMANDEGHGFAKKNNQDFLFYSQIKFMEKTLLP
jgi:dipeptidyl aminopeptidase/acylaminoacyl peptidase